MTPRRAARTDANQSQIVEALRQSGCVVRCTHQLGGGFPDLCVFVPRSGKLCLIEVKSAGGTLTDDEQRFFSEFAGAPVYIAYTVDEALAACGVEAYTWGGEGCA